VKYCTARQGRVFIIRLEDGDVLHECVERFAAEQGIRSAWLVAVGGADAGSRLIVGPQKGRAHPIKPQQLQLDDAHEVAGVGTIFPDEDGRPILHMHMAAGRGKKAVTGCVRAGVKTWHILEIVLVELLDNAALRKKDRATGFKLLDFLDRKKSAHHTSHHGRVTISR
jgi:predicted DNA-binding protein with PD1-like motif